MQDSTDPKKEFLTFSYVSLIERLSRIEAVIEHAEIEAPSAAFPVFRKLRALLNAHWIELKQYRCGEKLSNLTPENAKSLYAILQNCHGRLPDLHSAAVRWISGPWAAPQITAAILLAIEESLGVATSREIKQLSPIVAQVEVYDFLGDFRNSSLALASERAFDDPSAAVVWATPAAEVMNPLAWVMLFHEVGHTLLAKTNALQEAIREEIPTPISGNDLPLLVAFLSELLADRIAIDIAGPAYFAALTSFGILERQSSLRLRRSSRKHGQAYPNVVERVQLARDHLEDRLDLPFGRRGACDMSMANTLWNLYQGRCELDDFTYRADMQPEPNHPWLPSDPVWASVLDHAYRIVFARYFQTHAYGPLLQEDACRIAAQLVTLRPVSSSPDFNAFHRSSEMIRTKPLSECTPEERNLILSGLQEQPNSPISILNAGWITDVSDWFTTRRDLVVRHYERPIDFDTAVQSFQSLLRRRDDLVAKSIQGVLLHRELDHTIIEAD